MDRLLRDIRQSLRTLAREKTFTATVLMTLAVCLGANVAIFSVVHTVLLEPLPFHEPDRLVTVFNSYPGAGATRASNGTVDFFQRRENVAAFQEVALTQGAGHTVGEAGATEQVNSMRVTPSFFPLLGIRPIQGRAFTEDEMEEGNHQKVILTHGYWQEQFAGAPDVVGRELRVDGRPFTIVGVLGEDFLYPERADTRLVFPIAFSPADREMDRWHSNNFSMVARLAPGATVEQALAQNAALNDALIDQWPIPNARQLLQDVGYSTQVAPAQDDLIRDVKPVLYLLWGGVGFVLLIGCVNIANLMLARTQARLGEVATRLALGASRGRVARQILTESVVLGVLGGILGVGAGAVALRFLLQAGASQLPRGSEVGLSVPVLGFAMVLSVVAALLFGAIPMAQLRRQDFSPVFRSESRTGTASRRAVLLRNGLVTSQVSLAFVMLIGAGLMLLSFRSALSVNPGFEADGLLTAFVALPEASYPDQEARRQFWDRFREEGAGLPNVASLSVTAQLPFSGDNSSSVITPEGYVPAPGESLLSPFQTDAAPGYFETMGIRVLEGRGFLESDGPGDPQVIVIDEWLAKRYWPEGNAIGSRMVYGAVPGMDSIPEDAFYTVVGVVETIKQNDLTTPASEHVGAYYFSYRQEPQGFMAVTARASNGDAASLTPDIRALLGRLDPELPLFGVRSMRERIDESLVRRRVPMLLLGIFAAVALFLAVVGIYGALAYSVTQREKEIGIRMALGSAPGTVFRQVVSQGVRVTGLGLVVGAVAAFLLARLLESLLFGVQATDYRVMAAVAVLLLAVGTVACVIPARRATTVNPVDALGG
ncbi:MAG TPA: ABC transporter permease [Longimicrobiales bacterium]|nr:ABC transporter permease [Longimicrobiales bacterium]